MNRRNWCEARVSANEESMARHDLWTFFTTIETYMIGDIVKSTHTCVRDRNHAVVIVDLPIFGFAETTTEPILYYTGEDFLDAPCIKGAMNFSKRELSCYSSGCLESVIVKNPFCVEEYLTSEIESERLLANNLIRLQTFVQKVKKTSRDKRWRWFLPSEKVRKANRELYYSTEGIP